MTAPHDDRIAELEAALRDAVRWLAFAAGHAAAADPAQAAELMAVTETLKATLART
ncbi:hypothetical protein [Streptomyces sp. NPDC060184]|uniref:hypothetical protein n=1 Tax=Streptomyces sp. NPDC060184 TaxID=3347064 RepID=UPI003666EFD9